jgi:hypothetical protein
MSEMKAVTPKEILEPIKEVLGELFTLLEVSEARSDAILNLLKAQGLASDEKFAPHLEQAGNASSVKWRAARKRMEYLLSPIERQTDEAKSGRDAKIEKREKDQEGIKDRKQDKKELLGGDKTSQIPENDTQEKASEEKASGGKRANRDAAEIESGDVQQEPDLKPEGRENEGQETKTANTRTASPAKG